MNPDKHNPQEVEPRHGEQEVQPRFGISYDQLSSEVRPYADNLEAQVWAVFAKYGIVVGEGLVPSHSTKVGEGLVPSHTGGDKPRPYILDELKAANPSTEDLEHLADLLDQLDHIRKTGEPMERTKRELAHLSLEFSYNETEAKRLGLEQVEVKGYPEADALLEQVIDGAIGIETKEGQEQFFKAWRATLPDLPPPCVPEKNDFWYLIQLKNKRVIRNLEADPIPESSYFSQDEILLIDSWEETDENAPDAKIKHTSSLLKELLGQESVVDISRQDLDAALWQGDPSLRRPTQKHQDILKKLNLSSDDFELRLIRQDEYARLAEDQGWGNHNLWTNFDRYSLGDDGARRGLLGGRRDDGGPSFVGYDGRRGFAYVGLAVRLVLARKSPRLSRGSTKSTA